MKSPIERIDVYGLVKPRLRGWIHASAVVPFALAGLSLAVAAPTIEARVSVSIYAVAITSMLLASALYHCLRVSPKTAKWLRRVDHSMIGVAVAGTYTPVIALLLHGTSQVSLLAVMWLGALSGLVLTLAWHDGPRWLRSGIYVALGWAGVALLPWIATHGGIAALILVLSGGLAYTVGAVIYARRGPNLVPGVFAFHELFHTLVLVAVALHFSAIAVIVHEVA